jgi:hypothetical protein
MAALLTVAILAVFERIRTARAIPAYAISSTVDRFHSSVAQTMHRLQRPRHSHFPKFHLQHHQIKR